MFAAPEIVETEVVARLPDKFMKRDGKQTAFAQLFPHGPPPCFLEGPDFDRQGNLYFVDVPWGRIFKMSPGGQIDLVVEYEGMPNALKFSKNGDIYITDRRRGILRLDLKTHRITSVVSEYRTEEPLRGVNDLFFAPNGDLYFTDQGQTGLHDPTGRVYRRNADGQVQLLIANMPGPNGLCLSRDRTSLYVAATRTKSVWRLPLVPEGIGKAEIFVQISGGLSGPDGMALDESGNLYVTHAGLGCTWVFSEIGEPLYRIKSSVGLWMTNLAFGGPDMSDLYILESSSGSILRAKMPFKGRKMYGVQDGDQPA
jgi:gluconolactonase